jgi:hypothetical protein
LIHWFLSAADDFFIVLALGEEADFEVLNFLPTLACAKHKA